MCQGSVYSYMRSASGGGWEEGAESACWCVIPRARPLQHTATHCNTLQHTETHMPKGGGVDAHLFLFKGSLEKKSVFSTCTGAGWGASTSSWRISPSSRNPPPLPAPLVSSFSWTPPPPSVALMELAGSSLNCATLDFRNLFLYM